MNNNSQQDVSEKKQELMYCVKIVHSSEIESCIGDESSTYIKGDHVIVPTRYGKDLGRIVGKTCNGKTQTKSDIVKIVRRASEKDLQRFEENKPREHEAYSICREKIHDHNLEMKLVSAHYMYDEPKILFFFTADDRVDFRELVKDLVSVFKMRIELRQIGVRDESRVLGGIAVCGRMYCCHGLSDELKPVSIKMAKVQNMSLNSMKISGPCGRLLCCLSYEYDTYCAEKNKYPSEGNKMKYDGTIVKVIDVNILSKNIRLEGEDGRGLDMPIDKFFYDEKAGSWQVKA
jgi:cell fate regulator YaaT (PSP1 superfamily)